MFGMIPLELDCKFNGLQIFVLEDATWPSGSSLDNPPLCSAYSMRQTLLAAIDIQCTVRRTVQLFAFLPAVTLIFLVVVVEELVVNMIS